MIGQSTANFNNKCDNPVKLKDATAADAGKDIKPDRRLLETSEYHRQRYLSDAEKTVAQQYTTESTRSGTGLTA